MSSYNQDETPDKRVQFLCAEYSLLGLAILVTCGRFYSRGKILGSLFIDDWIILIATLSLAALVALHTVMAIHGYGTPSTHNSAFDVNIAFLLGTISRLIYPPTVTLIRLSVLVFVRRLSPYSWVHKTTNILFGANLMFVIAAICVVVFQCTPISVTFQPRNLRPANANCLHEQTVALSIPIISMGLDFAVWFVPVLLVVRMQFLEWKKKILTVGLLGTGLFACFVGMMRLPELNRMDSWEDPTWDAIMLSIWTSAELSVGITAASAPGLWPLIVVLVRKCTRWTPEAAFWTRNVHPSDEEAGNSGPPLVVALDTIQVPPAAAGAGPSRNIRTHESSEALFLKSLEEKDARLGTA